MKKTAKKTARVPATSPPWRAVPGAGVWVDKNLSSMWKYYTLPRNGSSRNGRGFLPMDKALMLLLDGNSGREDQYVDLRRRRAAQGTYEGTQEDIRHIADQASVLQARRQDVSAQMRKLRPVVNLAEERRLGDLLVKLERNGGWGPERDAQLERVRRKRMRLADASMGIEKGQLTLAAIDRKLQKLQDRLQNLRRVAAATKIQRAYRASAADPGTQLGRRTVLRRGGFDPDAHPDIIAPRGGRVRLPGRAR